MRCLARPVTAFVKWTAAGAALGLAGGIAFGLVSGTLWLVLAGDMKKGLGSFLLFGPAGAAAGLILAAAAWWLRAEAGEPPDGGERGRPVIAARVTLHLGDANHDRHTEVQPAPVAPADDAAPDATLARLLGRGRNTSAY